MARASKLHFVGQRDQDGRPLEYFAFVPARDLDEAEIASLTDEQYDAMTGGENPLYRADGDLVAAAAAWHAVSHGDDDGDDD